ncbi:MAG: ferric reductase-like transmembrane domain-containing protein [Phycisphaerales bacterium]
MSVAYTAIGWNRQKRLYDAAVVGGVLLFVGLFFAIGKFAGRGPEVERVHDDAMLLIRALGTCGLVLLHIVLWIGPLARLDPRLLPLLYNRRHLGVLTFLIGLAHAAITLVQYHGFGNVNPLVSLFTSNTNFTSLAEFPFELLGLAALVILFLMAATSHDFWLAVLSPRVWKWLHMSVYAAYALLVMHVVLGVLQQDRSPLLPLLLIAGVAITAGLHIAAGLREHARDTRGDALLDGLIDAGPTGEIALNRARVVCTSSAERIAVFKHTANGKACISAVANVCAHQQGPLGEGKVIDGCITCPWHGYQYHPADGCAPPPFTEKISTYRVTLRGGRVLIDPKACPPGTPIAPAEVPDAG